MDAIKFKTLIKEAVREAVREEIGIMLLEQLKGGQQAQPINENRNLSFTTSDAHSFGVKAKMDEMFGMPSAVKSQSNLKVDPTSDNPFAAFINDTAANLTRSEMNQMLQGG